MKNNYFILILFLFTSCMNQEYDELQKERKILDSIDNEIKILEQQLNKERDSIYKSIIKNDY